MAPTFTTVGNSWSPVEAAALRDALEAEGIQAFVVDGNLASVHPFLAPALGGIRVDVATADMERAVAVIRELQARFPEVMPADVAPGVHRDSCPACGAGLPEDSDACSGCGWTPDAPRGGSGTGEAVYMPDRLVHQRGDLERAKRLLTLLGFLAFGGLGFFLSYGVRSGLTSGGWQPSVIEVLSVLLGIALFAAWLLLRRRVRPGRAP